MIDNARVAAALSGMFLPHRLLASDPALCHPLSALR